MSTDDITPEMPVANDEILYRAVMNEARFFPSDGHGGYRISSIAFNDIERRPSVDRAALCPNGASNTQNRFRSGSGVLSLVAAEIRQIAATHGSTGQVYFVDVEPVPLPNNPAHAEIFGRPPFDTDKIFDRIKQALSRLAAVSIAPEMSAPTE